MCDATKLELSTKFRETFQELEKKRANTDNWKRKELILEYMVSGYKWFTPLKLDSCLQSQSKRVV